jgi:hypothetical protein
MLFDLLVHNLEWEFKKVESIKASVFQVIGVDIMIDSKYNAWLIEINNSPSMNIMFSKEFMPAEDDIELSEIDQEIKLPVLSDAFQLASLYRKDNEWLDTIEEHNSLIKIYSNDIFDPDPEFNVLHNLKIIYNTLTGTKGRQSLNSGQFTKMYANIDHLRSGMLQKPDMSLVFSSMVGRYKTMMDFTDFTLAMFKLFVKFKDKSEETHESQFPEFLDKIKEELV